MNKNNLILKSTQGMDRIEWLNYRRPSTHVDSFLLIKSHSPQGEGQFETPCGDKPFYEHDYLTSIFQSKEWDDFIFPTMGASDVATILGLNPYKSTVEFFYEKVLEDIDTDYDNESMFWGRELEDKIADIWQYCDDTTSDAYVGNFQRSTKINVCRRIHAYMRNKNHSWLYASLDRLINKQKNTDQTVNEGVLECKTISGWSAAQWSEGIPPMYVAQLQAQLLVSELEYGKLAILKDGRSLSVIEFAPNQELFKKILEATKAMFEKIKLGITYKMLSRSVKSSVDPLHYIDLLNSIAPGPDDSESYRKYLSKKYDQEMATEITGTQAEIDYAIEYKKVLELDSANEVQKTKCTNALKFYMKECSVLDLPGFGTCTWKTNASGTRVFRVNLKNR